MSSANPCNTHFSRSSIQRSRSLALTHSRTRTLHCRHKVRRQLDSRSKLGSRCLTLILQRLRLSGSFRFSRSFYKSWISSPASVRARKGVRGSKKCLENS